MSGLRTFLLGWLGIAVFAFGLGFIAWLGTLPGLAGIVTALVVAAVVWGVYDFGKFNAREQAARKNQDK